MRKEKPLLPWKVGGWIITRKTLILKGGWVGPLQGGLAKKWNLGKLPETSSSKAVPHSTRFTREETRLLVLVWEEEFVGFTCKKA